MEGLENVVENKGVINLEERLREDEENLEISIHVISQFPNNKAMRFLRRIGACSMEILMDSGSTHKFMNPLVV